MESAELKALLDSDILLDFLDGHAAAARELRVIANVASAPFRGWGY